MFSRKNRIELLLDDKSLNRLNALIKLCEADSSAAVFANSLQLYEALIESIIDGDTYYVKRSGSSQIEPHDFFVTEEPKDAREGLGNRATPNVGNPQIPRG